MSSYLKKLFTVIMCFAFYTHASDSGVEESRLLIDGQLKTTLWQAKNAKPKGIILISHGFSSRGSAMAHYAVPLAKAGYLVGAVTHENIANLESGIPHNDPMLIRQQQLAKLRATLKKGNPSLPVGMLGYSMGGFSVLSATGYQPQFDAQPAYCQTDAGKSDDIICNPRFTARLHAITQNNLNSETTIDADAIVLFAPAYLALVQKATTNTPTLLVYSEQDEFIAPQTVQSFINGQKNITAKLLSDAGHFAYLPACHDDYEVCRDPIAIDRMSLQADLNKTMVAFFNANMGMR